jgi:glycosyltransferase involved in cell wall biosynthesis
MRLAEKNRKKPMTEQGRVSVIINTHNRSKLLVARALASVQAQTFSSWECIVVDDGSTDDTAEVMRAIATSDSRIKYYFQKNAGPSAARNQGIRLAQGEFVVFTDDDDEFLPSYLERVISVFGKLPESVGFFGTGALNRDQWGDSYYCPVLEPFWALAIGNGWAFRRKIILSNNLFFDEKLIGFEDIDLHVRFRAEGYTGHVIAEPLRVYHVSIAERTRTSWSTNFSRHAENFEYFYTKNNVLYRSRGRDALAWLCATGGITFLRAGMMSKGRKYLAQSVFLRPNLMSLFYLVAGVLPRRAFEFVDAWKNRAMRLVRARLLSRVPDEERAGMGSR